MKNLDTSAPVKESGKTGGTTYGESALDEYRTGTARPLADVKSTPIKPSQRREEQSSEEGAARFLDFTAHPSVPLEPVPPQKATGAAVERSNPEADKPETTNSSPVKPVKWTVAIDLSLSVEESGFQLGGDLQEKQLKQLVQKSTGNKDVSIVVQTSKDNGKTIERWMIHDGLLTSLGKEVSEHFAGDLTNLLKIANKLAPSEHIALISESHGFGSTGVAGETGFGSLDQVKKAIQDGLAGSSHERLDVCNFDACLMGSLGVEDKLYGVADHIVSSEELMIGEGGKYDAEHLAPVISDLFEKPSMTPAEFSDDFVKLAARGENRPKDNAGRPLDSPADGTPTLAHFDSSKYPEFKSDLDAFGIQISRAYTSSNGRQVIDKIIGDMKSFLGKNSPNGKVTHSDFDLKVFTDSIMASIKNGSLPDPGGTLGASITKLRESQKKLVASYYGHPGTYDRMGGLSVYIPPIGERSDALLSILSGMSRANPN